MSETKFVRYRVKNMDPGFSGSPKAKSDRWQLRIERDVPNPDFVPRDETIGEGGKKVADTRTAKQKRRTKLDSRTRMHEGEPIVESRAIEAARAWMESVNADMDRAKVEADAIAEREREAAVMVSVPDYVDAFLVGWERNIEASTLKGYKNLAKHIRAEFEGVAFRELTGKQVNAWMGKMHAQGLSQATQVKAFRLLNLVCRQAVKDDDLDANPCDKAKPPKQVKADPNPLTKKSIAKLLSLLEGMGPTPLCMAVNFGIYMGLREGEICGLQWSDVDLDRGLLVVQKAIGRAEGEKSTYVKGTKTDGSARTLPIPKPMHDMLRERMAKMSDDLAQADIYMDAEEFGKLYVIGYIDGRYKNPNLLGKEWRGFAEAFDLVGTKGRLCTFHDTRHTFATAGIENGIDVKIVSDYLGHSNAAMTLNIYADATPEGKRKAADVMGDAYGK